MSGDQAVSGEPVNSTCEHGACQGDGWLVCRLGPRHTNQLDLPRALLRQVACHLMLQVLAQRVCGARIAAALQSDALDIRCRVDLLGKGSGGAKV